MGLRQRDSEGRGGYARLWSIEDKGNYSVGKISTSKKRKDGEGYETDFQDGFVRFIGSAHEKAKTINLTEKGITIQITSFEVTTPYDVNSKKKYTNYLKSQSSDSYVEKIFDTCIKPITSYRIKQQSRTKNKK